MTHFVIGRETPLRQFPVNYIRCPHECFRENKANMSPGFMLNRKESTAAVKILWVKKWNGKRNDENYFICSKMQFNLNYTVWTILVDPDANDNPKKFWTYITARNVPIQGWHHSKTQRE